MTVPARVVLAAGRARVAAAEAVSGASLAVFRIAFGLVAAFVAARWLVYGWVDELLVDPPLHFTYPGLGWVAPLPRPAMHLLFWVLIAAGLGVAAGYRFRLSAAVFALGMAYVQLIDQTLYINHYYWMILTAGVLACSPAHRTWSLDARRRPRPGDGTVPRGWVWGLRSQLAMVYVFAGVAKLGSDWLLAAQPLRTWLPVRNDLPLIGPLLDLPATAHTLSWAGVLFDLTIVGWLLWRRTRPFAYAAVVVFHVATWRLFPSIGVFPWPMIVGTTVFFAPDWPRRLHRRLVAEPMEEVVAAEPVTPVPKRRRRIATALLVGYVAAMAVVPLRHLADGGDLLWAGSGYRFGWRVMLTEKAGTVEFVLTDPASGASWVEPPPEELTARQTAMMAVDPALIRHTAELIAARQRATTGADVEVRADAHMAFNGRPHARLIDPTVDLVHLDETASLDVWVLAPPRR